MGTTIDLSDEIRRHLTSLAVELYWEIEDYYDAVEQVTERAEELGFEYIDASDNRLVIKITLEMSTELDEPLVAKLPRRRTYYPGGIKQNTEEIDLYREGPVWLREYLIPILDAHQRGFWLVMPYAPSPTGGEIEERKTDLLERGIMTNEILSAQNWGRWRGQVYLTDYGLGVASSIPDFEPRSWVDIVDEEDRRRGIIEDETTQAESEDDESFEDDEVPEAPPARRVVAQADVLPSEKGEVRDHLINEVVRSEENISVEIDGREIVVEILKTDPRSYRYSGESVLLVTDETRISL